ncbi:MAG TPA: hypothetical protein VMC06_00355 [Opitutaceae bacterium]|nr:hypothetical protein [Opitutaceae bacterium]
MLTNEYRFALEIRAHDGRVLGQQFIEPNWEPACAWARFAWWRKTREPAAAAAMETIIAPVAHRTAGLPFASGFRVTLASNGEPLDRCDFPLTYFAAQARAVSSELVAAGRLQAGDTIRYQLLAFPREQTNGTPAAFNVAEMPAAVPLRPASFAALRATAAPCGELDAEDLPVFLPQTVLEEVSALTEQAGAVETGGILIGHLCRDESIPDIGATVTAQIPARQARGELSKLTFTADTWAAVQAAVTLRRSDEIMLGWWHSHPARFWCEKECPPERRRACVLMRSFFSEDDVCLHEAVFPAAYHTALVVTNTDDGLQHALFGWRRGAVGQRGFHILNPDRPWTPVNATIAPSQGEKPHATLCQ